MREAWVIAKREFLERVRSKWFVVMTVLWPVLMVGMIVGPALLAGRGYEGAKVQILDRSGQVGPALAAALEARPLEWHATVAPAGTTEAALRDRIHAKQINGFVVVPADVLAPHAAAEPRPEPIHYYGDNASNQAVQLLLQQVIPRVVEAGRAEAADPPISQETLATVLAPVRIETEHTTGEAAGMSGMASFLLGFAIAFILYLAITLYGINVMRSIVTEKSNRVVELMVAATKPRAMMTGKIVGVGGAGLAQIAIWMVIGALALANKTALLHAFGASDKGGIGLPSLSAPQVGIVLVFFVLGYLFYSSMFAAVGAMVSSEQDSQQAQMPVTMLLVIAIVTMNVITNDPRGETAAIMTQVPFWSPILMPLRYFLGGASAAEVWLSLALLAVATALVARAAGKIYRVGILMYGKRPGLSEIVRWLRY